MHDVYGLLSIMYVVDLFDMFKIKKYGSYDERESPP